MGPALIQIMTTTTVGAVAIPVVLVCPVQEAFVLVK
jgi:hypothetical protein